MSNFYPSPSYLATAYDRKHLESRIELVTWSMLCPPPYIMSLSGKDRRRVEGQGHAQIKLYKAALALRKARNLS